MLDVWIPLSPDLHRLPVNASDDSYRGEWGAPEASAQTLCGQRRSCGHKGCVELPLTLDLVFHVNRK